LNLSVLQCAAHGLKQHSKLMAIRVRASSADGQKGAFLGPLVSIIIQSGWLLNVLIRLKD
jgi:hypothetical protein